MDSGQIAMWISASGTVLSLGGLCVALLQLKKTRSAAETATSAAHAATNVAQQTQLMSELNLHTHKISDIKRCIEAEQYQTALMMLDEVLQRTTQVKHMPAVRDDEAGPALDDVVRRVGAVRDQLQEFLYDQRKNEASFDGFKAVQSLSKAEQMISDRLGHLMYADERGHQR